VRKSGKYSWILRVTTSFKTKTVDKHEADVKQLNNLASKAPIKMHPLCIQMLLTMFLKYQFHKVPGDHANQHRLKS